MQTEQLKVLYVYTDGGSRGNPGDAASGVFITDATGVVVGGFGKTLGIATNNVAEYTAILLAFDWLLVNKEKIAEYQKIHFYMDSQLAYSQLVGLYRIKNAALREILFSIRQKEAELEKPVFYSHIPREKNKEADRLVNKALDTKEIVVL